MQDFMYSIIGVIGIFIHIIINPHLFRKNSSNSKAARSYRFLMLSIFAYYITDAGWGFFAGLNNIPALFLDTTVYFIAMVAIVLCWSEYMIEYLDLQGLFTKVFRNIVRVVFFAELSALVVNFFYPCFFWFEQAGAYQAGVARYAFLWIQVGLFFLTVLITGHRTLHSTGITRKRLHAIFFFSLDMLLTDYLQILFPLYPVYAMGCLIGCCILHVFIVEDEREEYRQIIAEQRDMAEQASRAKTSFLFNMSHDIRTPMNAILGYTSMAKKHSSDEQISGYLDKIDIAGNQLLSLVNQVLEMSRIESGTIVLQEQKINIDEGTRIVEAVYRGQALSKGLTFHVNVHDIHHTDLIGDADRLTQIMNNLLGNAMKYTPEGGCITYSLEELESTDPEHAVFRFTVEDNGIGMSEEFLPHLFEEFSREKSSTVSRIQGTGLGMSIVKKLVALMDGTISVSSRLGEGTKFELQIPLRIDRDPQKPEMQEQSSSAQSLAGLKILLVEDNEMNREIAEEILSEYGAKITSAEDGDIAVEKIRNSVAGEYDLVLMDIQMPRVNGFEATRMIRSLDDPQLAGIPIFAMTANAFEEDRKAALDAGMNGHLPKPIDMEKVLETLSSFKHTAP